MDDKHVACECHRRVEEGAPAKLLAADQFRKTPFPECGARCAAIRHLGAGECESVCRWKFDKSGDPLKELPHLHIVDRGDHAELFIGSAPEHAEPLGSDGWESKGRPVTVAELPHAICTCGWQGPASELLGIEENETLWCPQCRTWGNWTWR